MSTKYDLLHAHEGHTILHMSRHTALGLFAIFFFNFVDTFFISMLGTNPLSAISFTFPITLTITSCALGLATGMTTNVGYLIGQGNQRKVKAFITDALVLSFGLIALLAFGLWLFLDPLFIALGASSELLPLIREFLNTLLIGFPILVVPMVANGAMRAHGDARTPSLIMLLAGFINGILDPMLIFGVGFIPAMGIQGGALATVLAWSSAWIASIIVLRQEKKILFTQLSAPPILWQHWRKLLQVSIPAGMTNLLNPVSSALVIHILAQHNHLAVAGYGAAIRIESILMITIMSIASVLAPFIAQNTGAGLFDRAQRGLRWTSKMSFTLQSILYLPLWFLAPYTARIFSSDPLVIEFVISYFRIVAFSYGFIALLTLNVAAFNGIRASFIALFMDVSRLFLILLPLVYFGSQYYGPQGILYAICLANVIAGTLAILVQRRWFVYFSRRI